MSYFACRWPARGVLLASAIAALCAMSSLGQENLLVNPNFDGSASGWDLSIGRCAYDPVDGSDNPGSAYCDYVGKVATYWIGQCVDVSAEPIDATFHFGADAKIVQNPVSWCRIRIDRHRDRLCADRIDYLDFPKEGFSDPVWKPIPTQNFTRDGHEQSVFLQFVCTSLFNPIEGYFDDAYFGDEPPFFADGFEAGDLSAWSFVMS